jgi:endonuclease YncB( thermonuclease family)
MKSHVFGLFAPSNLWHCTKALAVFTVLFASSLAGAETPVISSPVSKIMDGDTFTLKGQSRRIRIWGLDAPERDEAGGPAATARLRSFISGSTLACRIMDIDRYGRLVGQCFLPDGRDIASEMIRSGTAAEFCRYSRGYYGTC